MSENDKSGPSTRSGVERTLVSAFLLVRLIVVVQAVVGIGTFRASTRPAAYLGCLGLALAESAAVSAVLVRRRSVLSARRFVVLDFIWSVLLLLAMALYVAPLDRVGSWLSWAFPLTLSTAGLVGMSRTARSSWVAIGSLALAGVYLGVAVRPQVSTSGPQLATGVANACAYPGFALVLWMFARFVRAVADEADAARTRVAELERDRSRAVVHDMLGYLRLDRLLEARPETQVLLVQQALTKYRQMRAYVDGSDQPGDVEHCLRSVVELYPRLDLRVLVSLDSKVVLDEDLAVHLRQAVDTALANVQANAPGARVVLTADNDRASVLVTVVDDGDGFDMSSTRPGFGIGETLGRQLSRIGGRGRVTSTPGVGTKVEIVVPKKVS